MTVGEIDGQIREMEKRIAAERVVFEEAAHACAASLRETLTSPRTLLTVAGVGFAVGKVVFRRKAEPQQQAVPVKKAGALGLLTGVAGTALSLAASRWGSLASWAARKYVARKKAKSDTASPVISRSS